MWIHSIASISVLVRFQKTVIDNASGGPPASHHNIPLALESISILRHDRSIESIVYDCYKGYISHHSPYSGNTYTITISQMKHWKHLKNVELFDFHRLPVESIYRVSSPCQFSWDVVEIQKPYIWDISLVIWPGFCLTSFFPHVNCVL